MIGYKRCLQHPLLVLALAALALLLTSTAHAASPARRIVSLGPALTEMLFALGLDQQVVGVTTYCNFPAAAAGKLKKAGFEQVYWLEGGTAAWDAAGLPLVKGRG